MISAQEVHDLLAAGLPNAQIDVRDPHNDMTHLEATIISADFIGMPRIKRHRMVYAALGDAFAERLHALKLTTLSPDEAK